MRPNSKFVMVSGPKMVSLTDTGTGKEVQNLFDPITVRYKDNGRFKSTGLNDGKTGWLDGGNAIYALSKDGMSCLIWSVN